MMRMYAQPQQQLPYGQMPQAYPGAAQGGQVVYSQNIPPPPPMGAPAARY